MRKVKYIKDKFGNNFLGIYIDESEISKQIEHFEKIEDIDVSEYRNNKVKALGENYFIKIIDYIELNDSFESIGFDLCMKKIQQILSMDISDLFILGTGKVQKENDISYHVYCYSDTLFEIRKSMGLNEVDFYIPLGFKHKEIYGIGRDESTYIKVKTEFEKLLSKYDIKDLTFVYDIENFDEFFVSRKDSKSIELIQLTNKMLRICIENTIFDIMEIDNKLRVACQYGKV